MVAGPANGEVLFEASIRAAPRHFHPDLLKGLISAGMGETGRHLARLSRLAWAPGEIDGPDDEMADFLEGLAVGVDESAGADEPPASPHEAGLDDRAVERLLSRIEEDEDEVEAELDEDPAEEDEEEDDGDGPAAGPRRDAA